MTIIDSDPRLRQPGRYSLGNNLYLRVQSSANRQFLYRYRFAGRQREKTLGSTNKISMEDARNLVTIFRQQLGRSAAPIYTPPRLATIRRLAEQLAKTQQAMHVAVEELDRLRRQFGQIFEPPLDAAPTKPSGVADDAPLAENTPLAETENASFAEKSAAASPIPRPRGPEPLQDEVKLAVESYYRTAISTGSRPTRSACSQVLQDHGYWPGKSFSFMYQSIRPYWPQAILSTPEE
jgi:hypothetical protein